MMKVPNLTVWLVVVIGLHLVDAQNDPCDPLQTFTSPTTMSCVGYELYIKCMVKESGLADPAHTNDAILNELKLEFDGVLRAFYVTCDFNLKSIVQQIQDENPQGVKLSSEIPKDYNHATTTIGCLHVFVRDGNVSCSELTPYTKCGYRVSGLAEKRSDELAQYIPIMQTAINDLLSKLGLQCDINVQSLVNEIKKNGGDGSVIGYCPFHLVTLITFTALSVIVNIYY